MRLVHQFQAQTVTGQGKRRAGAYRVGRTQRPHCFFHHKTVASYNEKKNKHLTDHLTYIILHK